MNARGAAVAIACALSACSQETRDIGPTPPATRPRGDDDRRIALYQGNVAQVSQGGRYFTWYGCTGCHSDSAPGVLNLADGRWRHGDGFAAVFASVADRHGRLAYGTRVPVEQLWQITAYARDLEKHTPEKRRRVSVDQKGEPQATTWSGPQ